MDVGKDHPENLARRRGLFASFRSATSRRACAGLITRRPRWSLSLRGWFAVLVMGAVLLWQGVIRVQPFLAITDRQNAELLIVEGWVHPYAIRAAAAETHSQAYLYVVTTGWPGDDPEATAGAAVAAQRLRAAGVPASLIVVVPAPRVQRDRTYAAAVAVRQWVDANAPFVRRVNVLTADVHARRSRMLFQRALGDEVVVGVLAVPSPDYDAQAWWGSSEGFRSVVGESLAYAYAKLAFFPRSAPRGDFSR